MEVHEIICVPVSVDAPYVNIEYANSFRNTFAGFYYGTLLNQNDEVDVIFHATGAVGDGLIESAKTFDYWAKGVDYDQSGYSEKVLCSAVKKLQVKQVS